MELYIEKGLGLEKKLKIIVIYFSLHYIMANLTYRERFNKKYKFPKDASHSLAEISKLTGYKLKNIKKIFEKGKGAFFSAGPSRPNMTPSSWAYGRVYASVSKGSKSSKIDKDLLN